MPVSNLFAEFFAPAQDARGNSKIAGGKRITVPLYGLALVEHGDTTWIEGVMLDQEIFGHRFVLVEGEMGFILYSNGKLDVDVWEVEVWSAYANDSKRGGCSSLPIPKYDISVAFDFYSASGNTTTNLGSTLLGYEPSIHKNGSLITHDSKNWLLHGPKNLNGFLGFKAELQ